MGVWSKIKRLSLFKRQCCALKQCSSSGETFTCASYILNTHCDHNWWWVVDVKTNGIHTINQRQSNKVITILLSHATHNIYHMGSKNDKNKSITHIHIHYAECKQTNKNPKRGYIYLWGKVIPEWAIDQRATKTRLIRQRFWLHKTHQTCLTKKKTQTNKMRVIVR